MGWGTAARDDRSSTPLREKVLSDDGARARSDAFEAWRALLSGEWSLVDRFEKGGRRYIVVRERKGEAAMPSLSAREGAVLHLAAIGNSNKLIAYELGLRESTIATHLSSGLKKIGIRSRTELVAFHALLDGRGSRR